MGVTILFGGTFDPVHHGHLITAEMAREALRGNMPAHARTDFSAQNCPPLRPPSVLSSTTLSLPASASAADRLAMLKLAVAGVEGFVVDDLELNRLGPSYTVDTVTELLNREPGKRVMLLIGSDQLPRLHAWHHVEELLSRVEVAIAERPRAPLEPGLDEVARYLGDGVAKRLREAVLSLPLIDLSATAIRQRVADGLPIQFLVPNAVATYIGTQQLYRGASAKI